MVEVVGYLVLGVLVISLMVERYFFAKHMTLQLEKCMKAVMSRNINDYLTATNEPKKNQEFTEPEEIDLDTASDEQFMEAINNTAENKV